MSNYHHRTGLPLKGCQSARAIKGNHERDAYGNCGLCGDGPAVCLINTPEGTVAPNIKKTGQKSPETRMDSGFHGGATPPSPSTANLIDRLKSAIEGECNGLAITDQQANAILAYVLPSPSTAREVDERPEFEAWASDPVRAEKIPLDRWPTNDAYKDTRTYLIFYGWKSGRAALAAKPVAREVEPTQPLCDSALRAEPAGQRDAGSAILSALRDGIPLQEPVYINKALRAQREARVSLAGGTGPLACVMLVNIQLTGWIHTKETAEAYAEGYNRGRKDYRSALLDLAAQISADAASRCRAQGGNTQPSKFRAHIAATAEAVKDWPAWKTDMWEQSSGSKVDVEAERKAMLAADKAQGGELQLVLESMLWIALQGWLAARRTKAEGGGEITDAMADAGAEVLYGHTRAEAKEWAKEDKFDSWADEARRVYTAMRAASSTKKE